MGNVSASEDAKRYREGYPGKQDNPSIKVNLEFYQNKRASKPEGDTIENIHKKWFGDYSLLEAHHGYIQWLFPIREDGMNHHAEQLQLHEAKAIAADPVLQNRLIKSYELMLDFYGIKLVDMKTGQLERGANWKPRYAHLNRSFHNYLRITRILKCLGECGLEHMKLPFVKHFLKEVYEEKVLPNCRESLVRYWMPVLRDDKERDEAYAIVEKFENLMKPKKVETDSDSDDDEPVKPAAVKTDNNAEPKKEEEKKPAAEKSTESNEEKKEEKKNDEKESKGETKEDKEL